MMCRSLFAIFFLSFLVVAAPLRAQEEAEINDPIEPFNRAMFFVNDVLDKAIIRPVAWTYREVVPDYGRDRVDHFFRNLGEPVNFTNNLLQGDSTQAFNTLWRFLINSTVGVVGLYDPAQTLNLPYRREDFGQTLGYYGAGPGFYLVLPVLGPSSGRDAVGKVVDWFNSPISYIDEDAVTWGLAVGEGVHYRSTILDITDDLERSSLDLYATYRSAFLQRRTDLIQNGNAKKF